MTAQLAEDEFPARTALKAAQEALVSARAAAVAAADALARGKETLGELEKRQDDVKAEVVSEARARAEAIEQGVCAKIVGAVQARRAVDDEIFNFGIVLDILAKKNADAQHAIVECEAALAAAVKAVVAEEVEPLLCRLQDCENAAAMLRSRLRSLQFCGKWGICPEALPRQLLREPANIFHANKPLSWKQQKAFDQQKSAWVRFADQLRLDANAKLDLGD